MDPSALKQANRNRFTEKQRAKYRHATPSDRKYRALKRQEQATIEAQEEQHEQPPSNEHRYHEDVTMAYGELQDEERNAHANRRVKELLEGRGDLDLEPHVSDAITKRNLGKMDVKELNKMLGREDASKIAKPTLNELEPSVPPRSRHKPQKNVPIQPSVQFKAQVPEELQDDQDFLDGII